MGDEQRARELICRAWAEGIAPDPLIGLAEWSDANVMLSEKDSAEYGNWRTSRTPYLREIMDCLSPSNPTQRVVFMKGTQVGGTSVGKNWIAFLVSNRGGPTMYLMPTSGTSKRASKTRMAPMIDAMPVLRDKIGAPRSRDSGNTIALKEFDGGVLIFAGANSAVELASQPVRNLFADEVDKYPLYLDEEGSPLGLAVKRTDTFGLRKKIYITSTPKLEGSSVVAKEFEASDQRHYYVPCPHCQHMQRMQWEQMRWQVEQIEEITCMACGAIGKPGTHCEHCERDLGDQQVTVRNTGKLLGVWYECEACERRIDEHHKAYMLPRGEWRKHAPGNTAAAGFHLSALYSPLGWYSWRSAVEMKLKADAEDDETMKQEFWNTVLGLAYNLPGEQPEADPLKERAKASSYRIGQVPAPALMLTAFVDVQGDRLECYVYGWGRGESAYLIDFNVLYGETSVPFQGAWAGFPDLLDKGYQHAGGMTLRPSAVGIDSGYHTHTVYMQARTYKSRHVVATKGQTQPGKPVLGLPTKVDISYQGKKIEKGVKVWPLGADTAKALIYARLKLSPPAPGAWHFPQGLPDFVFDQLTAEKCTTHYVRGFPVRQWSKDKNARNEALDCAVGAYAAAVYAGLNRVNWDRLEQLVNPQQRDMLATPTAETKGAEGETISGNYETDSENHEASAVSAETPPPAAPAAHVPAPAGRRVRGGIKRD